MASIQQRDGRHQVRIKVLGRRRPVFKTFPTRALAEAFVHQVEGLAAHGAAPAALVNQPVQRVPRHPAAEVVGEYMQLDSTTRSDKELLKVVQGEIKRSLAHLIDYAWVQAYVAQLKARSLTPGTIRKRIGALARVLDWHHRRLTGRDQPNPFRLLPAGYSTYPGKGAPRDVQRDRRLSVEELGAVRLALSGVKRPDRERALGDDPAFTLMFELILGTGLRLSEAFRLRVDQVDLGRGILRIEGSKGHRGALKPRNVPLTPSLRESVGRWCAGRAGLLFPFWDGKDENLKKTSTKLSVRFANLFRYAQVSDFTEHDLRHTACCTWVEMRRSTGGWTFSDIEVAKIMGWSNLSMMLRYASLRGEDLADRLLE